ncbi:MAG: LysR family transcriptional regulator [Planctomycetes bacterium]|nr:LysR family transcriptional regulator [Planctomycetota bacterium]
MELRHLRSFTKAAELQSFTRAAEELSLTQAAVSQHIAALEKELDVSLFDRAGRTMIPTDAGHRLYDIARQILNLVDEARSEVGQKTTRMTGTLRIATSTVPAETILPELLAEFLRLYPDVRESITVSDSKAAAEAIESGKADLALVGDLPEDFRLSALPLCEDDLILVVSCNHPLAEKKRITLEQLQTEPLIVRESGSGSRRCVERALREAGISVHDLKIVMEVNSNDAIRSAVERGLGATFLSQRIVERDIAEGRLISIRVENLNFKRKLYIVTNPDRIPTAPLRAFLSFLDHWLEQSNPPRKLGKNGSSG